MDDSDLLSKIKQFIKKTEDMIQKSNKDKKKTAKTNKRLKQNIPDKKCQLCEKIISHQEYFKLISNKDFCLCQLCKKQVEAKAQQLTEIQNFMKNFNNKFVIDETYPFTSFLIKEKDGFLTKLKNDNKTKAMYTFTFILSQEQNVDNNNSSNSNSKEDMEQLNISNSEYNDYKKLKYILTMNDNNTIQDLFFELIIKFNINIDCYIIEYYFCNGNGLLKREYYDKQLSSIFPNEIIYITISNKQQNFDLNDVYYDLEGDSKILKDNIKQLVEYHFKEIKGNDKLISKGQFLYFLPQYQSVKEYINYVFNEDTYIDFNTLITKILELANNNKHLFLNCIIGFSRESSKSAYRIKYEYIENEQFDYNINKINNQINDVEGLNYDINDNEDKIDMDFLKALISNYFKAKNKQRKNSHIKLNDIDKLKQHIFITINKLIDSYAFKIDNIDDYIFYYILVKFKAYAENNNLEYTFDFLLNMDNYYKDIYELSLENYTLKENILIEDNINLNDNDNKYILLVLNCIDYIIKEKYELLDDTEIINIDSIFNNICLYIIEYNKDDDNYIKYFKILITFLKQIKKKKYISSIINIIFDNHEKFKNINNKTKVMKVIFIYIFENKYNKETIKNDKLNSYLKDKFTYYMNNYKEISFHENLSYLLYYYVSINIDEDLVPLYKNTLKKLFLITDNEDIKLLCAYALTKYKSQRIIQNRSILKNFKKNSKTYESVYYILIIIFFYKKLRLDILNTGNKDNIICKIFSRLLMEYKDNKNFPINIEEYFKNNRDNYNIEYSIGLLEQYISKNSFQYYIFEGSSDKLNLLNYPNANYPSELLFIKAEYLKFPNIKLMLPNINNKCYLLNSILFEDYGDTYAFYCINLKDDIWFDLNRNCNFSNIRGTIKNLCGLSKKIYFLYKLKNSETFDFNDKYFMFFSQGQDKLNNEMIYVILDLLLVDTKNILSNNWEKVIKFIKKDYYTKSVTIQFFSLYFEEISNHLFTTFGKSGEEYFINKIIILLDSINDEFRNNEIYSDLVKKVKVFNKNKKHYII